MSTLDRVRKLETDGSEGPIIEKFVLETEIFSNRSNFFF